MKNPQLWKKMRAPITAGMMAVIVCMAGLVIKANADSASGGQACQPVNLVQAQRPGQMYWTEEGIFNNTATPLWVLCAVTTDGANHTSWVATLGGRYEDRTVPEQTSCFIKQLDQYGNVVVALAMNPSSASTEIWQNSGTIDIDNVERGVIACKLNPKTGVGSIVARSNG